MQMSVLNPETKLNELVKGDDPAKDQSYFLFPMRQEDLQHTIFPVGHFKKNQVRDLARKLELRIAEKPDSQDICFVQSKSYSEFVESRAADLLAETKGYIVDVQGNVLAEHEGVYNYTIGQRKGLGHLNKQVPLYVVSTDPHTKTVVVGEDNDLFKSKCIVSHMNWIIPPELEKAPTYGAKIRYRAAESPAVVTPLLDNRVLVNFKTPQRAITPGQALVLYNDDVVVGGGWIQEVVE